MQSCATLEEFFQQEYVKYYDEFDNISAKNMIDGFIFNDNLQKYLQYSLDGNYFFIDADSLKEYYFIRKSNLPSEIKNAIVGGDNDISGRELYADFHDVYAITRNLKVMYCNDSGNDITMLGAEDTATLTDLDKTIFKEDNLWTEVLGYNRDVTLQDLKTKDVVTITKNGVDFSKMVYFPNLEKIIFKDVTYEDLNGIENSKNLYYIRFEGTNSISDFSAIANVKKLSHLYLIRQNQDFLDDLMALDKGIGGKDIETLRYIVVTGYDGERFWATPHNELDENSFLPSSDRFIAPIANINCLGDLTSKTKEGVRVIDLKFTAISDISVLKDFKGITMLCLEGTQISTLAPLKTMSNLEVLACVGCKIGLNTDNTDSMKYFSLTELCDSLSCFGDCKNPEANLVDREFTVNFPNLYYLDLRYNSGIVWINYLSGYGKRQLRTFNLMGNSNLNEIAVANIKEIVINTGRNVESKYNLLLLDSTTTSLKFSGLTFTEDFFLGLGVYDKAKVVDLSDVVIKDSDGNVIEDSDDINTLVNSLLSNFKNLREVSLCNWSNYSDLSFVKTEGLNSLIYLDLRGTKCSTLNEETGLQLLNTYQPSLGTILLPENYLTSPSVSVDLTLIQEVINKCGTVELSEDTGAWDFVNQGRTLGSMTKGCLSWDIDILKKLPACTSVEHMNFYWHGVSVLNKPTLELDLSSCVNLKTVFFGYAQTGLVTFPTSLEVFVSDVGSRGEFDFSQCKNLKYLKLSGFTNAKIAAATMNTIKTMTNANPTDNQLEKIITISSSQMLINNLPKLDGCINLKTISIGHKHWVNTCEDITDLTGFESLSELENLTRIRINQNTLNNADLSSFCKLEHLTHLELINASIEDISFLNTMKSNVQVLDMSDNNILKGIKGLYHLKDSLTKLVLARNKLEDPTTDTFGTYWPLEEIAKLNANREGVLTYLDVSGNSSLKNYSYVMADDLDWSGGRQGF